ncbi:hypothetical protein [Candidatus Uabimicrobium amorphum]|uniref:Peptidase S74 domain-containing protein n=1 Tax=Uabimicrobium amorphum TaxID=2596890 RepID=A0A5S9IR54_UABAM|nr:hypothetical protein [Candidatus Uabimicrobium amorphum]BBM86207.1 hypothetical protein UABAM_04593 [Candidatus Uabimicrobium amorphum]
MRVIIFMLFVITTVVWAHDEEQIRIGNFEFLKIKVKDLLSVNGELHVNKIYGKDGGTLGASSTGTVAIKWNGWGMVGIDHQPTSGYKLAVGGASKFVGKLDVDTGNSRLGAHFKSSHQAGPYIQMGEHTIFAEAKRKGSIYSPYSFSLTSDAVSLVSRKEPLHIVGSAKIDGELHVNKIHGKDGGTLGASSTGNIAIKWNGWGMVGIDHQPTNGYKLAVGGASKFVGKLDVDTGNSRLGAHFKSSHQAGPYIQMGEHTIFAEAQRKGSIYSPYSFSITSDAVSFVSRKVPLHILGSAKIDGDVGIGTTTPSAKLHVNGSAKFVTYPPNNVGIQIGHENGNAPFIGNLGGDYGLNIVTKGEKRIHVTTDGFVHVHSNLNVNGSVKFVTYPSNNVGIQIGHKNGNAPFIGNLGGDYGLSIITKGEKRIHVATDGFVHVYSNLNVNGILNVTNGLEVKGKSDFHSTIQTNNNDILLYTDTAHGVGVYHPAKPFNGFASSGPVVYGYNGGALGTTVSGQKVALQWNNNNQVGINCKPHQHYELAVNGEVIATEIVVESGWADFVFDDDYKLMPLEEVEQQINKNKHLPDIPSEEEIKAKGVPIGKMQAKLLQKIEELTLYTINQEKKIKFQNQKMGLQDQKIKLQDQRIKLLEKLVKEISTK